jgi:branched-chain amino acid transport system substrate-binding protein
MRNPSKRWCLVAILILSSAVSQTVVAQDTIAIGSIPGWTGPPSIAGTAGLIDGAFKDCVAITNEEGGINGKKLRAITADDQYKPDVALKVLDEVMAKEKPLCIFGSGTPAALAVAPVIRDRYKILYTSTSFSAKVAFSGASSMFVVGPTYGDQFAVALKYIAQVKKGARVAFFYSKGPFGEDPLAYGRVMSQRLKLDLVGEVAGDIKGGDHTTQIEELKSKNPDFVIMTGWVGPSNAGLLKQSHDLGLKSQFILTLWGANRSVVEQLGPSGPEFMAVSPYAYWWMEDVPMIKKMREYTAKHHPEVKDRPLDYVVPFTAAKIFVECLRKADSAGELNPEGLIKVLQSVKDLDTGGLTPPLTIKENRFPVARILKSSPEKGILEPVSDWIKFY